jgi:hypothetical protein
MLADVRYGSKADMEACLVMSALPSIVLQNSVGFFDCVAFEYWSSFVLP